MQKAKDVPLDEVLEDAFWVRTQRDEETGCLLWMGYIDSEGYARVSYRGKTYPAHRVSYCLHHRIENLPDGFELDHLCCVRPCVDWTHLEAVTPSVNNLRGRSPQLMRERRLRTYCPRGHALSGENLLIEQQAGGYLRQRCRECWRQQTKARGQRFRLRKRQSG